MRAAVLQIGARYGFTTIMNDFGRPGIHNLQLQGAYGAELEVGHQQGTWIALDGGTFLSDDPHPCSTT